MNDIIYCYPGSSVLINYYDIRNEGQLLEVEKKLSMLRILELQNHPILGDFSLKHLCEIHRYIFQDIYPWAGKLRTVDIAKENLFCRAELIETSAKEIFPKLRKMLSDKKVIDSEDIAKQLAYFFSEINALHPFREGNGRAQREFIRVCALSLGYDFDLRKTTPAEMLEASKASFLCEYGLMEAIFLKCLDKIE